ncbi:DNA polymerase III subunit delta [Desulfuromonas versatilis]|uniref:DNA polymerase III subunit delta n=1 Tax=Desulfuromonas versatilis TaxID=2802975 RepID=A0ABN6DYJ1_9BACT|nr:DNA polymerase III subunit delta [Desulfuromonas versatilis]BCR05112.1 DNA polymerase III subunit delta [Desulfuromonas versatilis]
MTPTELKRAIQARKIPELLFLYGEEGFYLDKAVQTIREALVAADTRDFNFSLYHGKTLQAEAVLDTARTLPVLASHRLVLIKDAQEIPAAQLEAFIPYLKDPVAETCLTFVGDKIDGRKKFFQEFKKHGALVEFKKLYENQIPAFVQEQARERQRSFTEDALALFCRRVGSNLQEVHGELGKLFDYLGAKTLVDTADVAAIVSDTRVDSIFDLTNVLGRRDAAEGLRLLGRLLDEGVAPLLILNMMVRHFRQLWKTRELVEQGVPHRDLARRVGVNPYFIDGLVRQCKSFGPRQYPVFFDIFLAADLALKSSGAHPSAVLENLVLTIAAHRDAAAGRE